MKKIIYTGIFIAIIGLAIILTRSNETTFNITQQGFADYNNLKVIVINETINQTQPMTVKKGYLNATDGNLIPYVIRIPNNFSGKIPGIVFMPGALVPKEYELGIGIAFAKKGFTIITIDQPTVGENKQQLKNGDEEVKDLKENKEPSQLLFVSDYLLAYEYLKQQNFIDENKIILAGESNGGRIAIIASEILTSKQEKIKGLVLISTAGFGFLKGRDADATKYVKAIDSEYYAEYVRTNTKMFQSPDDKTITIDSARRTFERLPQEKEFIIIPCKNHGSCEEAYDLITSKTLQLIN